LLIQEFADQAKEILDQTKKAIEQKCKVFDKMNIDMIDKGAPEAKVNTGLKAFRESLKLAGTASSIIDANAFSKGADLALGFGGAVGGKSMTRSQARFWIKLCWMRHDLYRAILGGPPLAFNAQNGVNQVGF